MNSQELLDKRKERLNATVNTKTAYYRRGISFLNMLSDCCFLSEDYEEERELVISMIENNSLWERNNYESFINSMKLSKHLEFLTNYTPEYFKENNVETFKLTGYNIGYALKPYVIETGEQCVDIISVHNNSSVKNIGKFIIESAIKNGGNTLDHFDGFLTKFYESLGFVEYARYKWDEQYAPKNWNYNVYGTPDVICRKLK